MCILTELEITWGHILRKEGLDIPEGILTKEELAEALSGNKASLL